MMKKMVFFSGNFCRVFEKMAKNRKVRLFYSKVRVNMLLGGLKNVKNAKVRVRGV